MSTPQFGRGEWAGDATGEPENVPADETQALVEGSIEGGGNRDSSQEEGSVQRRGPDLPSDLDSQPFPEMECWDD